MKAPYTQLLSVHAFVKQGECEKQIPLVFVLMSGKFKADYEAVFAASKELVGDNLIEEVMVDFEPGLWSGMRVVFPGIRIKGCTFHWAQAVFKKIQEVGLAEPYRHDEGTHILLRKLMALPFVPHEFIRTIFNSLAAEANNDSLKAVFHYVNTTWMTSTTWPPEIWCCYLQTVRTNNDVEGWHGRLNRHAGCGQIQFYLLVDLLHEEATYAMVQAKMVRNGNLQRYQRKEYKELNRKLMQLWSDFNEGEPGAKELLRKCSKLYGPVHQAAKGISFPA